MSAGRRSRLVLRLSPHLSLPMLFDCFRTKMYQRANLDKPPLVSWLEQRRRVLGSSQATLESKDKMPPHSSPW